MDIIVTTPEGEIKNAALESEQIKSIGSGNYFRYLGRNKPSTINEGDKIYYVEDGYIRGFCIINKITRAPFADCNTTGKRWRIGWYTIMDATTWQWIKPIEHKGFQGWRYLNDIYKKKVEVAGNWLDPKPII